MHKCFKCGTEFEGNFCPECGEKYQEEKICPKCGAKAKGNAKFCSSCGYSFVNDAVVEEKDNSSKKETTDTVKKIYKLLLNLPSILFVLFSVLMMLFFLAPVAVSPGGEIFGEKIPSESYGNVYQMSNYEDTSLPGSLSFLMGLGIASLVVSLLIGIFHIFNGLRQKGVTISSKKIYVCDILTGIGYVIFFIMFIVSCVIMGQISSEDEGMGLISSGPAPILVLVFSLLLCIIAVGSIFVIHYFNKTHPSFAEEQKNKIENLKPTKIETWVKANKKPAFIFASIVAIVTAAVISVSVLINTQFNGTYYEYNYNTEEYNMKKYYEFNGNNWEDEEGNKGSVSFEGEKDAAWFPNTLFLDNESKVIMTYKVTDSTITIKIEGTIMGDALEIWNGDSFITYVKEGHVHNYKSGNNDGDKCCCGRKEWQDHEDSKENAFDYSNGL